MEPNMDSFDDYLNEMGTTKADHALTDLGSLVALAIIGAGTDYKLARESLEDALKILRGTKLDIAAQEILGGAIYHLTTAEELADL